MSEKNAAFHRLAAKRVEGLADQIRIFSNLSGPSYEWTVDEVTAYFDQIQAALTEAMARFQEQKNWKLSAGAEPVRKILSAPVIDEEDLDPEIVEQNEETAPVETKEQRRKRTIGDLIRDAKNDTEMLPEMLVFQKEAIANLNYLLDECRARHAQSFA